MEKTLTKEETKEKALRLLEFRSHSEHELREKLRLKGAKDEDIDEVIEFLCEYSLLDDLKYALSKARELATLKKFGKIRIVADLKSRGIRDEYIAEAISELEIDECEVLSGMLERKLKGNFEQKNIDKAIRYFAQKGYRISDIKNAISNLESEI